MSEAMPDYTIASAAPPVGAARFQLRPLSTGEVLDRSLSLFRTAFWFCLGLTLIPALITLLSGAVRLAYIHFAHLSPLTNSYANPFLLTSLILGSLLSFATFGFASAGVQWGVGSLYLGRPFSFQAAIRIVWRHWFRYAALAVVQIVSSGWITLLLYGLLFGSFVALRSKPAATLAIVVGLLSLLALVSIPYSVYRYIRIALAMPASVMEGLGVRDALRRSKALLPDRKGRIFVLFLLLGAFYLVIGTVIGILSLMAVRGAVAMVMAQATTLLTTFAASLLLQPFFNVAICLFYYDERVRREGFDIEFMMQEAAAYPVAAAAGTAALPEGV